MSLVLHAVEPMGITRGGSGMMMMEGRFYSSVGPYKLSLAQFAGFVELVNSVATWRNKLTMYSQIKLLSLHAEEQELKGEPIFQTQSYRTVWEVVGSWVPGGNDCLDVTGWKATRYGNTHLKPLLAKMLQEARGGKCAKFSQSGYSFAEHHVCACFR